jgi:hypothetical protein
MSTQPALGTAEAPMRNLLELEQIEVDLYRSLQTWKPTGLFYITLFGRS